MIGFRSLFSRNVALLFGLILLAQLASGLAIARFIIRAQAERSTLLVSDMIDNLSTAMAAVPAERRAAVIDAFARRESVRLLPAGVAPPGDGGGGPTLAERSYMRVLARRLERQREIAWRTDGEDRLWLRIDLGGRYYWMSISSPRVWTPFASLTVVLVVTVLMALIAGYALQRRLSAPLRDMARAADRFDPQRCHEPLDESGPSEIARLARALNRMRARLSEFERERGIMLAGISHDLRTPLARLRLALDMVDAADPALVVTAVRQAEVIETLLGQFLDFARGFDHEPRRAERVDVALAAALAMVDRAGEIAVEGETDRIVAMRPGALARAIANLSANALVHGRPPVRIVVSATDDRLCIAVRDAGAGFGEGVHAAMLRPFSRGDAARGGAGAGLGLAIAERAVAAMEGRLAFSADAQGFVARISLPAGRATAG